MDDDDDDAVIIFLVECIAAVHQLICSYCVLFDDLHTAYEKRIAMKRQYELTPYKHNVSYRYSTPVLPLEPKNCLSEIPQDSNRGHIKLVTHLHEWQFFQLADKLKDLIIHPHLQDDGTRPQGHYKPPKFDHYHCLLFALPWLNDGLFH
jgi:hypothetical protein